MSWRICLILQSKVSLLIVAACHRFARTCVYVCGGVCGCRGVCVWGGGGGLFGSTSAARKLKNKTEQNRITRTSLVVV